jgi:transposase InsO family protein
VSAFIDERRADFGVERICRTLDVSASAYYERKSGARSARSVEDERLLEVIRDTHAKNYFAYGYRRMWIALGRAGEQVARCRVQRLMKAAGDPGRQAPRQAVADDQAQPARKAPSRSRRAQLQGLRSRPALGRRPDLPALLGGARLLRVRR